MIFGELAQRAPSGPVPLFSVTSSSLVHELDTVLEEEEFCAGALRSNSSASCQEIYVMVHICINSVMVDMPQTPYVRLIERSKLDTTDKMLLILVALGKKPATVIGRKDYDPTMQTLLDKLGLRYSVVRSPHTGAVEYFVARSRRVLDSMVRLESRPAYSRRRMGLLLGYPPSAARDKFDGMEFIHSLRRTFTRSSLPSWVAFFAFIPSRYERGRFKGSERTIAAAYERTIRQASPAIARQRIRWFKARVFC